MFSSTFRYGLKAAVFLALEGEGEYVKVRDMSVRLGVPRSVLAKALHTLGSAGVIETLRGPSGGCRWRSDSDRLTIADLAEVLEEGIDSDQCPLGLGLCGSTDGCILPEYSPGHLYRAMDRVSMRELADRCSKTTQFSKRQSTAKS